MKNTIYLAFALLVSFSNLNAQGFSFGAKAGANFANLTGDGVEGLSSRTGFHLGAVAHIGISEKFGIQPELIYSQQGTKLANNTTLKLDYLNIPILADISIIQGFSLQAGPQFGININDSIESDTPDIISIGTINTFDFSVAVGAQFKLDIGLFFQARYNFGLNDYQENGDGSVKNSNIAVSIGYFFR